MYKISKEKLKEIIKKKEKINLIDIREKYEWENGKLSESNIPMDEFLGRINEIRYNDDIIILYCKSGKRSKSLSFVIKQKFNLNIYYLEGGYENYIK